MKLRVRSLESKETLKIEVPDSSSLQLFKESLSRAISCPSSSLHLSLNRKDEINASTPNESLKSIGIASGDLVFYSLNSNAFTSEIPLVHKPGPSQTENSDHIIQETPNQHSSEGQMEVGENDVMTDDITQSEQAGISENMEIVDGSVEIMEKSDSEPSFVKRVLRETLVDDFNDVKLLIVAVHAILLESGFVLLDKVSGMAVHCSNILDHWPATSTLSVRYSLPEILTRDSESIQTVVLKFQNLGQFVNVYGSLSAGASGLHRVIIDKCKFAPALGLMLAKSDSDDNKNSGVHNHETEVFQLWKMIKDGLALPLLIDLCEKAGLDSPPCFMRLPTELKLKVLDYLHGVEIAKVACTCSEMRYLSSNNDLWKQKFEELVGRKKQEQGTSSYKVLFANEWVTMQNYKRNHDRAIVVRHDNPAAYHRIRRDANPFGIPSILGGDYDRLPGFGVPSPFGQPGLPFPPFQPRRRYHPMCNLQERNA